MLEKELHQYIIEQYPKENERCEWKEFKNLKNSFCGDEKDDVISYVSAIANMEGGYLVIGVQDETLEIVGTDTYNYDKQKWANAVILKDKNNNKKGKMTKLKTGGLPEKGKTSSITRPSLSLKDQKTLTLYYCTTGKSTCKDEKEGLAKKTFSVTKYSSLLIV